MAKRRQYNTLGRRILSVLSEGGPRKYNVLLGYAESLKHGRASLDRALHRLVNAGLLVRTNRRSGGVFYALAER